MAPPRLQFWYEFASTYSYLAACRIERAVATGGVEIEWHPFLLGPIFAAQGWATYEANFADDREISDEKTIADIVRAHGHDPVTVLARASSTENKEALRRQTDEAQKRGIFGAPSVVAGDELFWGNERLDEAIEWCRRAACSSE